MVKTNYSNFKTETLLRNISGTIRAIEGTKERIETKTRSGEFGPVQIEAHEIYQAQLEKELAAYKAEIAKREEAVSCPK